MKKISFVISTAILILSLSGCSTRKQEASFKFPNLEKISLENGINVFFVYDKSLPYVSIQSLVEAGSSIDPQGKEGLSFLTFEMLKEGSVNRPGQKLKEAYSNLGTSLNIDIDRDYVEMSTKTLSKYSDQLVSLFIETMTQPKFEQSAFNKTKSKHLANLQRASENPGVFVDWLFYKNLYGTTHPYSYSSSGTKVGVKNVTLTDVKKFYQLHFEPKKIQIAITGLYTKEAKKHLIEKLSAIKVSLLKAPELQPKKLVEIKSKPTEIIFVDKPGMAQAEIRLGYLGTKRNNSDYIPLYVANAAIGGGGFASRLMQEVRVKRGLVYGIRSSFLGLKSKGPFQVAASTRHEKIPELLQVILQELESARLDGLSDKELKDQKSILMGQFPRSLETNEYYVNQVLKLHIYGFDQDYLKNYLTEILDTSKIKANEMLKKYYRNTDLVITVLGSKSELTDEFSKMGIPIKFVSYKDVGL